MPGWAHADAILAQGLNPARKMAIAADVQPSNAGGNWQLLTTGRYTVLRDWLEACRHVPNNGQPMSSEDAEHRIGNITSIALVFEGAIGLLALGLGWYFGVFPLESVVGETAAGNVMAMAWGLAAAVPFFAALVLWDQVAASWMGHLREVVRDQVVPLFRGTTTWQRLLISLAAGVGEELLYRGLVQVGLAQWIGQPHGRWVALLVASVFFGVCHWVTGEYALLATVIGLALGGLFLATGNLLAPIAMHALYDFLALVYLVRRYGDVGTTKGTEIGSPP